MKKIQYILTSVLLMGLLFSCRKYDEPKKFATDDMKYPVTFSIAEKDPMVKKSGLRASEINEYVSKSYENERKIENLTILVFNNSADNNTPGALELVITDDKITKENTNVYGGNITFDLGYAGTFHFEVIANGYKNDDADAKAQFLSKFEERPITYAYFQTLVLDKALSSNGESGFTMISVDPTKVQVVAKPDGTSEPVVVPAPIKLRRLAARFDVFNRSEKLELTKITLKNQITKSYIFTQSSSIPEGGTTAEKVFTKDDNWFTKERAIAGIYSYENPIYGNTSLEIEGTYDGKAWKQTIKFEKLGKQIAIQRNHIYRVHLVDSKGDVPGGGSDPEGNIRYDIEVVDWEEDETFGYSDDEFWNTEKDAYVGFAFEIINPTISQFGGQRKVRGIKYLTNKEEDQVYNCRYLADDEYTIMAKEDNPEGMTVDDANKTITIAPGEDPATYTIIFTPKKTPIEGDYNPEEAEVMRMVNPLSFVTEYNIADDPDFRNNKKFMITQDYKGLLFLKWDDAMACYKEATIDGKDYHLPSKAEWCSIVPEGLNDNAKVRFDDAKKLSDISLGVMINGKDYNDHSDYQGGGKGSRTAYAHRYKETALESAWKYEHIDGTEIVDGVPFYGLKVTARNITPERIAKLNIDLSDLFISGNELENKMMYFTIEEIAKPSFWANKDYHHKDIVRYFPAGGWKYNHSDADSKADHPRENGHFWSCDQEGSAWCLFFQTNYTGVNKNRKDYARTIRLFKGKKTRR